MNHADAGIIRAAARHIGLGEAVPGGLESVDLAPPEEAVAPARPLPVADAAAIDNAAKAGNAVTPGAADTAPAN